MINWWTWWTYDKYETDEYGTKNEHDKTDEN